MSSLLSSVTRIFYRMVIFDFSKIIFVQALPPLLKELEELKEFWDPDTVELMEWIK